MNLRKINRLFILLFIIGASHTVSVASADSASVGSSGVGGAFMKGSTSVGVVLGSGTAFNDNYTILGVSVGYYVVRGLNLGIDLQRWFSGEPSITKVSPQINYVFTQPETVKPYIGTFYRRTYYGDYKGISLEDQDSYGFRAGAYFTSNNRFYFGAGAVYEEYIDCNALADCSSTYPELLFYASF